MRALLLILLTSCAAPLLQPGLYDVEVVYVQDYWPRPLTNEIRMAVYKLEGEYRLVVVDSHSIYEDGHTEGNKIVFQKGSFMEKCTPDGYQTTRIELKPLTDTSFEGEGRTTLRLCSMESDLVTVVRIRSVKYTP